MENCQECQTFIIVQKGILWWPREGFLGQQIHWACDGSGLLPYMHISEEGKEKQCLLTQWPEAEGSLNYWLYNNPDFPISS